MAKVTPAMARHEMARREEVRREQTARPTAGETMTPDQLARVERLRDEHESDAKAWARQLRRYTFKEHEADADALSALLREREALLESVHYANGVADLAMKHRDTAEAERDALRAALEKLEQIAAALLTGTTARTED